MTSSRKRAGSEQSRTAYSTAEQDSLGENEKDRINKLFLPLFKEPEPWAHFERSHCSRGAQGAPEETGDSFGMRNRKRNYRTTTWQFLEPLWSHLTPQIGIHWFCTLWGGWHRAWKPALEQQRRAGGFRVPGIVPGGISPTTFRPLSVDDNGLGLSSFQRTRKWFLSSNESFNVSNLGTGGTPCLLNTERKAYFTL